MENSILEIQPLKIGRYDTHLYSCIYWLLWSTVYYPAIIQ